MYGVKEKNWGKLKWLMMLIMGKSLNWWNFKEGWDVIHLTEQENYSCLGGNV